MSYTIDKNIPPPPKDKYPFATLEPGDSFSFPLEELKRVKKAAYNFGRKHPKFRFVVGTVASANGAVTEARCWRLALSNGRASKRVAPAPEDLCGLCGRPGANKLPHPVYWPGERKPDRPLVHLECEQAECDRASAELNDREREAFLKTVR